MAARHLVLLAVVCSLVACAPQPPEFPTNAPSKVAPYSADKQAEKPPESRGVDFIVRPESRSRITMIVAVSACAFLLVFVIALFSSRDALAPAGIAAALFGPVVAIAVSVRQMPEMLMRTREPATALASLSLDLWNLTQPLLYAIDTAAVCLIVLTVAAGLTRTQAVRSTLMTILPLLVIMAAGIAFGCYASVSRILIGILDPVHPFHATSIAEVASATAIRITTAYAVALFSTLLIPVTIVLSFVVRQRPRAAIAVVLIALVLAGSAAFVEHSWCALLEATARTGRVPY
jgi:hypothetical protein